MRALSHTCRSLRNYTLPLLWSVVGCQSVNALGKLRDALRLMPHLAPSVRSFSFSWDLCEGDCWACLPYNSNYGTMLDMAFIDRGALWDSAKHFLGARDQEPHGRGYFVHDDVEYLQPGLAEDLTRKADAARINRYGAGPDCNGEDPRIKSPDDFNSCITEIVAQLTSLTVLKWDTEITPIPPGVFKVLRDERELKAFETSVWCWRSFRHGTSTGSCRKHSLNLPLLDSTFLGAFVQTRASHYGQVVGHGRL